MFQIRRRLQCVLFDMLNKYFIVQIAENTFILHSQWLPLTRLAGVELQMKNQLEICKKFETESNFDGSNPFGTVKICSRQR